MSVTQIPFEEEYTQRFEVKFWVARVLSAITPKAGNTNLLFEKESRRAEESGFYVFEKIIEYSEEHSLKSNNYFILDGSADGYEAIKHRYGGMILKKYSFAHIWHLVRCDCLLSSDLANHCINPRVYNKKLNNIINKKPFIFLQHGIMFAKPVDNPAAMGFWKKNMPNNLYKSVISSELEAEQFYRMGYSPNDLIKSGLPKLDIAFMSDGADKILFMPTWRYWEEAMVHDESKIEQTTYYKSIVSVIEEFVRSGLADRLRISIHPKFRFAAIKSTKLKNMDNIFVDNVSEALADCRIFITDYSSASYDAHFRGANVIYFWKEREYLIENYEATPALDETNCDGIPVYGEKELIQEVNKIIARDYAPDPVYEDRYSKIVEFRDRKNWLRLVRELEKLEVL
jgi:hypothetical protein